VIHNFFESVVLNWEKFCDSTSGQKFDGGLCNFREVLELAFGVVLLRVRINSILLLFLIPLRKFTPGAVSRAIALSLR